MSALAPWDKRNALPARKPDSQIAWLNRRGWRIVAKNRGQYHNINLWDHPQHQPSRRGFFTQTQAIAHQKKFEKNMWCDCVHEQEPELLPDAEWREA